MQSSARIGEEIGFAMSTLKPGCQLHISNRPFNVRSKLGNLAVKLMPQSHIRLKVHFTMQISPQLHLLPLGWLPLTQAARSDGFLPIYRRLERDGFPIFDACGYLDPDLNWRHGRGVGDTELESDLTLRLLKSSAETVSGLQDIDSDTLERRQGSTYQWPPEYLSQRIPDAHEIAHAWFANDATRIQLTSPTIPKHKTRTEWLKALPEILPVRYQMRLNFLARNPAHLVRVGVQMLCMEWDTHGQSRHQTAEALAIINLGALGLFPRVRCAVCFRLALPASTRCAMHSQTQAIRCNEIGRALHTQISSDTRKAREVMAKLGWRRNEFAINLLSSGYAEENVMGGILWGLYSGVDDSLQQVRDFLLSGQFPHVAKILPKDFTKLNNARACACLRQHIDPCEWDVGNWFYRLLAAEEWLAAAAKLTPGRAHMQVSDLNQNRYVQATDMLRQGLNKKSIAGKLGISQSHLSHLLKRLAQ